MWLDNLKMMKKESGLTTAEIAEKSNVPEPTLEKIFAGVTKGPKLGTMISIVHTLGYTMDDLDIPSPSPAAVPPVPPPPTLESKIEDLNDAGRDAAEGYVDYLLTQPKYRKKE